MLQEQRIYNVIGSLWCIWVCRNTPVGVVCSMSPLHDHSLCQVTCWRANWQPVWAMIYCPCLSIHLSVWDVVS